MIHPLPLLLLLLLLQQRVLSLSVLKSRPEILNPLRIPKRNLIKLQSLKKQQMNHLQALILHKMILKRVIQEMIKKMKKMTTTLTVRVLQ